MVEREGRREGRVGGGDVNAGEGGCEGGDDEEDAIFC